MINEITGDIIAEGHGIIAHQANYAGVMGGGVAYSIRQKLLSDTQYGMYQRHCAEHGAALLGTNQYLCGARGVWIANMFCQNDFVDAFGCLTNYEAMRLCLQDLRRVAEQNDRPIFIPGKVGCGIAGGNWLWVKSLIETVMAGAAVPVTIVYWNKEVK